MDKVIAVVLQAAKWVVAGEGGSDIYENLKENGVFVPGYYINLGNTSDFYLSPARPQ